MSENDRYYSQHNANRYTSSIPNNPYNHNPYINTINNTSNHECVLIEKHYVPYQLYNNIYNHNALQNQTMQNQSTYNPIHYNRHNLFPNTLQSYNNNNNYNSVNNHSLTSRIPEQHMNTINSTIPIHNTTNNNHYNEGINIRRHSTPNPLPFTNIYNTNSLPIHTPINPPFTSNNSTNNEAPISNILSENNIDINRLINNIIHPITTTSQTISQSNSLPYEFEISNFGPIGTGFISTIATNNSASTNNQSHGIPLSTINLITNVTRYCDHLNNNNNNNDICSICQIAFTDTTICRVIKNCNHIFHINCIDTWLHEHTTCPFCRYDLLNITIPNENSGNEGEGNEGVGENSEYDEYDDDDDEEDDEEEDDEEEDDEEDYYDECEGEGENSEDSKYDDNKEDDEENYYDENKSDNEDDVIIEPPLQTSTPLLSSFLPDSPTTLPPHSQTTESQEQIPNLSEPIINTEPMLNDINTFISMSTPFINNFIHQRVPNSNASPRINSEQINSQINNSVNQFVNQLNPLLQSFNNFGNRN